MNTRWLFGALMAVTSACSENTGTGKYVHGSLDGVVVLSAPAGGMLVTAYAYDETTGDRGVEVAHSDLTDEQGTFHLDLGIYSGPLLLLARGNPGTTTEPATGNPVAWDDALALRAPYVARTASGDLDATFARGTVAGPFVIGPFSELSVENGIAAKSDRGLSFVESVKRSMLLFHDHLEVDFWQTVPVDLTTGGARTWMPEVQAGLEYAGLSELVFRMAQDSHSGGLSTSQLLALLVRDASAGRLDGSDPNGRLQLGTCSQECPLSDQTLRSDFADSMADFLKSAQNQSTLAYTGIDDFFVRIASRQSELFPGGGQGTYDVTPPSISIVAGSVLDDATGSAVALTGSGAAVFSRYVDDYAPTSSGLPDWRFSVTDDHTPEANLSIQAQLEDSDDQSVLVPWFVVPYVSGAGYDAEIVISTALYAGLAQNGNYQIEIQARDEKGNVSPSTFALWQQTILPAPAPTITVVDSTVVDESVLVASVDDSGPVFSGTASTVVLSQAQPANFSRFATHYTRAMWAFRHGTSR